MIKSRTYNFIITSGSLIALFLGFFVGIIFKDAESDLLLGIELFGKAWINALILLVIPLAVSYLIFVILSLVKTRVLGKVTGYSLFVHICFLLTGMAFSVVVGFSVLQLIGDNLPLLSVNELTDNQSEIKQSFTTFSTEYFIWLSGKAQKILGRIVLIAIFVTIIISFLFAKAFPLASEKLIQKVEPFSLTSMKVLQYFLLSLPLAVFSLTCPMAAGSGFSAIGVAGVFILILSLMLIVFICIVYVAVYISDSGEIRTFSKGIISSQIVAISTRSSLATMPSMLKDAQRNLGIPKEVSAIVIPFFVSLFRMNRVISSPFKFIFLIYVYQLNFDVSTFLFFLFIQLVVSFGSPGIPSGGKYINMPIYVAAGIPLEGYILLKAVDVIPDIFKTLLNVTEVMAVTSIVAKKGNWKTIESLT